MLGRFSCSSKPPLRRSPLVTALALPGVGVLDGLHALNVEKAMQPQRSQKAQVEW